MRIIISLNHIGASSVGPFVIRWSPFHQPSQRLSCPLPNGRKPPSLKPPIPIPISNQLAIFLLLLLFPPLASLDREQGRSDLLFLFLSKMGLPTLSDSMASPNLQIWNNAAFDDGSASKATSSHPPPVRSVSTNPCGSSLDLDPSKENRSPDSAKPLAAHKKPAARVAFREDDKSIDEEIEKIEGEIAGLQSRLEALRVKKAENSSTAAEAVGRMRGRIVPAKFMDLKQGTPPMPASKRMEPSPVASAGLRRRGLSLGPLEILATPAKSLDPKRTAAKNLWPSALKKKTQESPAPSAKVDRRGLSLGPLEIHESFTLDQPHKASGTPLRSVQSCKKPSSQKLQDSKEVKGATKERGKSLSPKPRPPATAAKKTASDAKKAAGTPATVRLRQRSVSLGPAEIASNARSCRPNNPHQDGEKTTKTDKLPRHGSSMSPKSRQPSTTAAKKPAKEDQSLGGVRPKALFQENSSTSSCKRPSKTVKVRVVPSRYSLASTRTVGDEPGCKRRKWSLPELGKEKTRGPRRRSSGPALDCKRSQGSDLSEDQVMMDSKIPDNLDAEVSCPSLVQESPPSVMKIAETLPKIKTLRCNTESPRDSGCVKRAVELVGRKSYFAVAEGEELSSPCEALNFHEHM